MLKNLLLFVFVAFLSLQIKSLDNGLARVPAMGWNTWNKFACKINETLIRQTADQLVEQGFLDAGYTYLNVDDCWAYQRNSSKYIQPDPKTFPSGMLNLSRYIHSKGMKFGIYSDSGLKTCARRPGSLFHEKEDAASYAEWEVDYLKYDNCFAGETLYLKERYLRMRNALNATGRPIYYSMCEWGFNFPWNWAQNISNSWRISPDIKPIWLEIELIIELLLDVSHKGGPGAWNDPDMLEIGIGSLTQDEQKTHFAIWAITKSPLIFGADLTSIRESSKKILLNKEIIALNQDPLGIPGARVPETGLNIRVVYIPLQNTDVGVVIYNRSKKARVGGFEFRNVGWPYTKAKLRDLYEHEDIGSYDYQYYTVVPAHGVKVYRVSKSD